MLVGAVWFGGGYCCVHENYVKLLKGWRFVRFFEPRFQCINCVKLLSCRFVESFFSVAFIDSKKSYKPAYFRENQLISVHNRDLIFWTD